MDMQVSDAPDQNDIEMLRDSVRRFARSTNDGGGTVRRQMRAADPDVWSTIAENGWLGAGFDENQGGFGGGVAEILAIQEEIGRGLILAPYLANIVAGRLIAELGSPSQSTSYLTPMIAGALRLAVASLEPGAGYDWNAIRTTARSDAGGFVLNGAKVLAPGGGEADWFIVSCRDAQSNAFMLFLLDASASGLSVERTVTLSGGDVADIRLDDVRVNRSARLGENGDAEEAFRAAMAFATIASGAEAIGAMDAVFDLTLSYLKQREQFGQPLARNQALQHRLVDMRILIDEAKALIGKAATLVGNGDPFIRDAAVHSAKIHVCTAARLVAKEAVQMHGAIGTTDEAIVSHYFKRLVALSLEYGDKAHHSRKLASSLSSASLQTEAPANGSPALGDREMRAFDADVRAFVRDNLNPDTAACIAGGHHLSKAGRVEWEQALSRKGWLAYTWLREDGGPGWSADRSFLFEQITAELNAPGITPFGIKMIGPVLLKYGTDAQRRRHLPGILDATTWWCQGYSEPGAGSDLASLSTRAERRGDTYVVNGQKIWTSTAHWADWMFALVRTSRENRKQDGISFLLIDMRSPGIEVRPILATDGHHGFNEVFFTDVEVPVANRVGEEGKGWTYAKYLLSHERLEVVGLNHIKRHWQHLCALLLEPSSGAARAADDFPTMTRLVDLAVRKSAIEARVQNHLSASREGGSPSADVSALKIRGTELSQDMLELTMDCVGPHALAYAFDKVASPNRGLVQVPAAARTATANFMYFRAFTILGGSTEIQKNIISKSVLGV